MDDSLNNYILNTAAGPAALDAENDVITQQPVEALELESYDPRSCDSFTNDSNNSMNSFDAGVGAVNDSRIDGFLDFEENTNDGDNDDVVLLPAAPVPFMDLSDDINEEYGQDDGTLFVSRPVYEQETARFDEFLKRVLDAEKKMHEIAARQPRSAEVEQQLEELKAVVAKLRDRLETKAAYFDTLRIEQGTEDEAPQISWAHLNAGLNRHRHHTPNATTAEFYDHKKSIIQGLKTLYEPLKTRPRADDVAETPQALKVPLLKHQKYGLKWLLWRERQEICGGILADDMGLGKTISMIAVILSDKEQPANSAKDSKTDNAFQLQLQRLREEQLAKPKFTLFEDSDEEEKKIVVKTEPKEEKPNIDMDQEADDKAFQLQIRRFKQKQLAKSKLGLFDDSDDEDEHKAKKRYLKMETKTEADLKQDDEDPVENDGAAEDLLGNSNPNKASGNLVICPASVMYQWQKELIDKVVEHTLKVHVYHGSSRKDIGWDNFKRFDVVITSYSIMTLERRNLGDSSWLFRKEWKRIILDEAHIIRNFKTMCCQAACELRATCRWALTGTPIQNRAQDAFALLRLLQVRQFNELRQWQKWLNEDHEGHRRLSFVLQPLMLRRTKAELQANGDMPSLPVLKTQIIEVELSTTEVKVYQILLAFSQTLLQQYLMQRQNRNMDLDYHISNARPSFIGKASDLYSRTLHEKFLAALGYSPNGKVEGIWLLVLLLRLRQFCCHPGLIVNFLHMLNGIVSPMTMLNRIYSDNVEVDETLNDTNELAQLDDEEAEEQQQEESNPEAGDICASALELLKPSNAMFDFKLLSSKMLKVLQLLAEILDETNDKVIVVSQWPSYLIIFKQHLLTGHNVEALEFNGTLSVPERLDVLQTFNDRTNDKRVLLLSLTAGGVGLNLNVANHLLMIDLHWNPQLERQAQDRVYRYGQEKPTFIYRFICIDTVEERIKALQDHKLEVAKVVLTDGGWASNNGLSIKDLKKLFGLN